MNKELSICGPKRHGTHEMSLQWKSSLLQRDPSIYACPRVAIREIKILSVAAYRSLSVQIEVVSIH